MHGALVSISNTEKKEEINLFYECIEMGFEISS